MSLIIQYDEYEKEGFVWVEKKDRYGECKTYRRKLRLVDGRLCVKLPSGISELGISNHLQIKGNVYWDRSETLSFQHYLNKIGYYN